jgi:hypothetical protein
MADYFAVLTRTLSGFSDAKPNLREKLYDRARGTIRKQLEMRNPPLEDAGIEAEMAQLEEAITRIEGEYSAKDSEVSSAAPTPSPSPPAPTSTPPAPMPEPAPKLPKASDGALSPSPDAPVFDRGGSSSAPVAEGDSGTQAADAPIFDSAKANVPAGTDHEPQSSGALAPSAAPEIPSARPSTSSYSGLPEADIREDLSVAQITSPPVEATDPAIGDPQTRAEEPRMPLDPMSEAEAKLDAWKDEFVNNDPAFDSDDGVDPSDPTVAVPVTPEVSAMDSPRARRAARAAEAGGGSSFAFKIVVALIVVILLVFVALFAVPQLKSLRNSTIESLGLTSLLGSVLDLDDPARPNPVRTISITPPENGTEPTSAPDPAPEPAPVPEPVPTPEPEPAPTQVVPGPKDEDRLGEDGAPAPPPADPLPQPTTVPAADGQGASNIEAPTAEPAAPAQLAEGEVTAILWEEGSTPGSATMHQGAVVWSLTSESPATGLPEEPVISGRMTVPDRSLVLLLSIKRNVDEALPASHLIELVFAVPDDFPGGAVSNINRFALKESEQARGENLIGVPARLDDGIFLIALNNLQDSRQRNVNLLRNGNWIDIPLEYRTGRRALVAMEKGATGQKVFQDAIAAWANLN